MLNQTPNTPEFDIYRVDSLRSKIDADDYNVDIMEVADKFIDLELALLGAA
jgi:anti-sigma28 factor (negative regulator of flagellin synthesis)